MGRLVLLLSLLFLSHSVRVIELDELDDQNATESSALVVKQQALPVDYWSEEKVLDRCSAARRNLVIKSILGLSVIVPATAVAVWFTLFAGLMGAWAYSTSSMVGFYFFFFATPVSVVGGGIGVNSASHRLTSTALTFLLGIGRNHPACCCPDSAEVGLDGTLDCHLAGSTQGRSTAVCPASWTHMPTECATAQVDTYSDTTAEECTCVDAHDCKSNPFFHGHPWCRTTRCGKRYRGAFWRRWDFCTYKAEEINAEEGGLGMVNEALAKFEPNVYRRGLGGLLPRADFMYKIGVWTDGVRGVATAKPKMFGGRQCFAAVPEETLDGCAQRCLDEGAPSATMMSTSVTDVDTVHECVAFAYNRRNHLCVRLPAFAKRAEFFPHVKAVNEAGWQNFIMLGSM